MKTILSVIVVVAIIVLAIYVYINRTTKDNNSNNDNNTQEQTNDNSQPVTEDIEFATYIYGEPSAVTENPVFTPFSISYPKVENVRFNEGGGVFDIELEINDNLIEIDFSSVTIRPGKDIYESAVIDWATAWSEERIDSIKYSFYNASEKSNTGRFVTYNVIELDKNQSYEITLFKASSFARGEDGFVAIKMQKNDPAILDAILSSYKSL